jgi:hypothetical protein
LVAESTPHLISVIATRVGALALIFFLVQTLIPLYRCSTRLASFYASRADALYLLPNIEQLDFGKQKDVFNDLAEMLSPDHLDFGKTPRSPIGDIAAVAAEPAKRTAKP